MGWLADEWFGWLVGKSGLKMLEASNVNIFLEWISSGPLRLHLPNMYTRMKRA